MPAERPIAVVWGNCQAEPLTGMLTAPLAEAGYDVRPVPPVYLVTPEELVEVRRLVSRCSLLVTQPVRPEYRTPGTGSAQMAALAPAGATVLSFPVAYDSTEFPFQVVGHGADGGGVFAPLTSYHDLRLMHAADQGWDPEKVLEWWPGEWDAAGMRAVSEASLAEMRRREQGLDATVSEALARPGAMFTVNHPANAVLTHMANGVLRALSLPGDLTPAGHEELSHTATALEPAVIAAHGWDAAPTPWRVGGIDLDFAEVVGLHLWFYSHRPDVLADSRVRHAEQRDMLTL